MAEVFGNYLEAGFAHRVRRQIHAGYALYAKQHLDLLGALLPNPISAEIDHLKTPHFHHSAQKFPQGILRKSLNQASVTLSLNPERSISSII